MQTTNEPTTYPQRGWLHLDGWAGHSKHPVEVLGRRMFRGRDCYRVRMLESAYRYQAGRVLNPPTWAVTF